MNTDNHHLTFEVDNRKVVINITPYNDAPSSSHYMTIDLFDPSKRTVNYGFLTSAYLTVFQRHNSFKIFIQSTSNYWESAQQLVIDALPEQNQLKTEKTRLKRSFSETFKMILSPENEIFLEDFSNDCLKSPQNPQKSIKIFRILKEDSIFYYFSHQNKNYRLEKSKIGQNPEEIPTFSSVFPKNDENLGNFTIFDHFGFVFDLDANFSFKFYVAEVLDFNNFDGDAFFKRSFNIFWD